MLTVDSLSMGIAVSASETTSPGPVLNNQSPPESEPTRHDVRILEFSSALLRMRTFGPALVLVDNVEISLGPYTECDLKWFNNGIEYSSTYFKHVFPAGCHYYQCMHQDEEHIISRIWLLQGTDRPDFTRDIIFERIRWHFSCIGTTR